MPSVAEQLRQGRATRNLSVHDVAEATKIRTDHLRALEEGDYRPFAAPVYIRGFVRTYSILLKLDTDALLKQLDEELVGEKSLRGREPLSPREKGPIDTMLLWLSRLPLIWLAALGAILIAGIAGFIAYRAWQHYQSRDPVAGLGPDLYDPARSNRGEYLPLPPSAQAPNTHAQ